MKRDFKLSSLGFRFVVGLFFIASSSAFALTDANPYSAIIGRNAFALKPPTPLTPAVTTPVVQPPGIELQGITTILGRPQVLLKIKLPARPPEPAKDQSVVLDVGQREGEVEVLEINVAAGSVKLRNQGDELPLNMQDNAAKPQAAPAIAGLVPAPGLGLPHPNAASSVRVPAPGAAPSVTTIGGGSTVASGARPSLPTRNMRGAVSPQAAANDARTLPYDVQAALIEVERERTKAQVEAGQMPPLPPMLPKE